MTSTEIAIVVIALAAIIATGIAGALALAHFARVEARQACAEATAKLEVEIIALKAKVDRLNASALAAAEAAPPTGAPFEVHVVQDDPVPVVVVEQ